MDVVEEAVPPGLRGHLMVPTGREGRCRTAVLVLGGSSGRVDVERATLFARHGACALALGWFGGPGQPADVREVALEGIVAGVDHLAGRADHVAIVGLSRGAEAALLVACRDPRVTTVVALSPSAVAWAHVDVEGRQRSSWTWRGEPLPHVPYDLAARPPASARVELRPWFEASLAAAPEAARAAAVPIEQATGHVVLVAGGDDRVWPSVDFARRLAARRRDHGRSVDVVVEDAAGHRPVFPGESPAVSAGSLEPGGTPEADAALGVAAWTLVRHHLGLTG